MDLLGRPLRFVVVALAVGCAHGEGREDEVADRPRETRRSAPETRGPSDGPAMAESAREIDEDSAIAFDTGAGTPRREASLRVMEEGKGYLIARRSREASRSFLRAVQIDPSNGFAYYYLGRARIASGDRRGAVGVLQKAETLLGPYPEWREYTRRLIDSLGSR